VLTLPLWVTLGKLEDPSEPTSPYTLTTIFFLLVTTCWAILVPAKFWVARSGDAWTRRLIMLGLGGVVGLTSLWLTARWPEVVMTDAEGFSYLPLLKWSEAGVMTYFALAFFALRWWKLTDRRRAHRFSFAPILAAGFWGLVLLIIWDEPLRGTLVLTMSSAIVQLVSPWEPSPPPLARRMRLRYA